MIIQTKVLIIGAGPAGLAAAIQLKRYGIDSLLIDRNKTGSLLKNALLIENYPGYPAGISGIKLLQKIWKQVEKLDINTLFEKVIRLSSGQGFYIAQTASQLIEAEYVIIASGTKALIPELDIDDSIKKLIAYEVFPFIHLKNKQILVVGAGDAAFDYALNLSRNNKVCLLNRGKKLKCLALLKERQEQNHNITYLQQAWIEAVHKHKSGLNIICVHHGKTIQIEADYLLFAIGRKAALDFIDHKLLTEQGITESSKSKLYFAGDVKNGLYRQAVIAAGDGIKVAMKIYHSMNKI